MENKKNRGRARGDMGKRKVGSRQNEPDERGQQSSQEKSGLCIRRGGGGYVTEKNHKKKKQGQQPQPAGGATLGKKRVTD